MQESVHHTMRKTQKSEAVSYTFSKCVTYFSYIETLQLPAFTIEAASQGVNGKRGTVRGERRLVVGGTEGNGEERTERNGSNVGRRNGHRGTDRRERIERRPPVGQRGTDMQKTVYRANAYSYARPSTISDLHVTLSMQTFLVFLMTTPRDIQISLFSRTCQQECTHEIFLK